MKKKIIVFLTIITLLSTIVSSDFPLLRATEVEAGQMYLDWNKTPVPYGNFKSYQKFKSYEGTLFWILGAPFIKFKPVVTYALWVASPFVSNTTHSVTLYYNADKDIYTSVDYMYDTSSGAFKMKSVTQYRLLRYASGYYGQEITYVN